MAIEKNGNYKCCWLIQFFYSFLSDLSYLAGESNNCQNVAIRNKTRVFSEKSIHLPNYTKRKNVEKIHFGRFDLTFCEIWSRRRHFKNLNFSF